MKHGVRNTVLVGALLGSVLVAALAASGCSGEELDPPRTHSDAGRPGAFLADGAPGILLPDGAVVPIEADDAGPEDPPPNGGIDSGKAFDRADAYVETLGPSSRSDAGHAFAGNVPPSNPKGTICINCHKAGGTADGMPFFAGGTVKQDSDGGPAASVEVRLKAYISFNAVSSYTDEDGNWFITKDAAEDAGVVFSVRPGIRNAVKQRAMGSSPALGACNKCHIAVL
jgi:hypothetical protein